MEAQGVTERRRRRSSQAVVDQLLDAALVEFAAHGYAGASTRAIAERAGAHQPQINYHFTSKEALWQAAVDRLFAELGAELGATPEVLGEDLLGRFASFVRAFVGFSARRPELHRIMNQESTADSPQLAWVVSRHIAPRIEVLSVAWSAVREAGAVADLDPAEVWELLIGFGALPYANAPLRRQLFGPVRADDVDRRAARLIALLAAGP
ncbi:MAG: TetR/AcrR family transcriptional regulator [Acidimicrobiales bacterium]